MGVMKNVSAHTYPKQSEYVGERVAVIFYYDESLAFRGVIVRDDMEAPWRTTIRLDDGRYIMASECQYRFTD